jgi:hypothetical protein
LFSGRREKNSCLKWNAKKTKTLKTATVLMNPVHAKVYAANVLPITENQGSSPHVFSMKVQKGLTTGHMIISRNL